MKHVLGVLSGTDMPLDQIGRWARSADIVLAADGGANVMHDLGIDADAAVGDFDSITPEARMSPSEVVFDPDQDRTDCDKLLSYAEQQGHRKITLCNLEGDLLDHVLATLQSAAKSKLEVRLALRRGVGYIQRANGPCNLDAVPGTRISVIPLEECKGVQVNGVFWSLSGQTLSPTGRLSISNKVTEPQVTVRLDSGVVAIFLFGEEYEEPFW